MDSGRLHAAVYRAEHVSEVVHYNERTLVWPLRRGVHGLTRMGQPCELELGRKGWMRNSEVAAAVKRGDVELMVGRDAGTLTAPDYDSPPVPPRRKRGRPRKHPLPAEA